MSIDNLMLVVFTFIAAILLTIGGVITLIIAIKRKRSLVLLFSASWLIQAIFWYLDSAAHFYYSIPLMRMAFIPQSIGVPCMFIFIELIKKDNINQIKMN